MNRADLATIRAIFDIFVDPLILLDGQRHILRLNEAGKRKFGSHVVGHDLSLALRSPQILTAVDAALGENKSSEVEFSLADQHVHFYTAKIQPLFFSMKEEAPRAILTLHDITDQRQLEQLRIDFLTNASHELKTPLASLLGFIETLQGPAKDDAEAHERFLAIMHDQAGRMARIVQDLLSLARIELDEHTPPTGMVDLADEVRRACAQLEPRARSRNITFALQLPEEPLLIPGDDDQLMQVLQNLIENAIKYADENTPIEIRLAVEADEDTVRLSVQDHGPGMAKHHLPRLTERFYRIDTGRSRSMGGTGLGLSIVKHILNRHRGQMEVESEVGQGTCFHVILPLRKDKL